MPEITSEDVERVELLEIVSGSKTGLKMLSKEQLQRLYKLVEAKKPTRNEQDVLSKNNHNSIH